MLAPKQATVRLRTVLQTTRCLSTTAVRPWATPTSRPTPTERTAAGNPVDDIDLVFDYPTEGQSSHQKQPLESSGLDLHSALPHHPKPEMKGQTLGTGNMGKEVAPDSNAMYRYMGIGALGLGGLYMMMRRQSVGPKMEPSGTGRTSLTQPGDLKAQRLAETKSMHAGK
ncbi:hypothetical protein N0V88_007596 [Collariella sp. IMI 366227]|nr:hypothetical protein N0V88_007596 [Collariella sp. IMI 366227]